MVLTYKEKYASRLENYRKNLLSIEEVSARREEFCRLYKDHLKSKRTAFAVTFNDEDENEDEDEVEDEDEEENENGFLDSLMEEDLFKEILSNLFPTDEDKKFFLEFALQEHSFGLLGELKKSGLDIYEYRFDDGKSALHYVADLYESTEISPSLGYKRASYVSVIQYFLINPGTSDDHGYSSLHAACMLGPYARGPALLKSLLRRGAVDVERDTGYERPPLHVAAQYRHPEIVKILLAHGADPNQPDRELSTPLHALARLNADDRVLARSHYDSEQRPADEIVRMLVEAGADLGARNRHGDTPAQLALARLDPDLAAALLRHDGAETTLDGLSEDRMFRIDFSSIESKCRLIRLNVIGTVRLLKSRGYFTDFFAKLRAARCWKRALENDAFNRVCQEYGDERFRFEFIVELISMYRKFGLYITKEDMDDLLQRRENLRSKLPEGERDHKCLAPSTLPNELRGGLLDNKKYKGFWHATN
uniref:Uncharacterized protein n=1 Tax=Trichogramma kaykai TaxID=54128 RepID=A0ABD2WV84_9HYME